MTWLTNDFWLAMVFFFASISMLSAFLTWRSRR